MGILLWTLLLAIIHVAHGGCSPLQWQQGCEGVQCRRSRDDSMAARGKTGHGK